MAGQIQSSFLISINKLISKKVMESKAPKQKETLSTKNLGTLPLSVSLKCTKTISNWERADAKAEKLISVNAVAWNPCLQFNTQFVTVDDLSRLTLYKDG